MKKTGSGWLHVFIAGALTIGAFFAYRAMLIHYLTGRYYGGISGGSSAVWFILCFLMIVIFMMGVSYFTKYLLTVIMDREKYVTVHKSSIENKRAEEVYQKYYKRTRMIREIDNLIVYVIVSIIIMVYSLKQEANSGLLAVAIFFIVLIVPYNPIALGQMKKARSELNSCFLTKCDAVLLYDIYEHSRLYPANGRERDLALLMQAETSYFKGDYPELASKLSQCKGRLPVSYQLIHMYYRGIYALDTGDRESFYGCIREMDAFVMKKSLTPQFKQLVDIIRREWTIRADLIDADPGTMIPVIAQMIPNEKNEPDRMNRIFQLAWLQLRMGDKVQAKMNLQTVADGAGTMAIRKKAVELLGQYPDTWCVE